MAGGSVRVGGAAPPWVAVLPRQREGQVPLPKAADVVVIGAGIVGLCSALEMARRGLNVVVVEQGGVGADQSSLNMGFVRRQGRRREELPLAVAAHEKWASWGRWSGEDIEWLQCGLLRLADTESELDEYRRWNDMAGEFGVVSQVLTRAGVEKVLPAKPVPCAGAIYTPTDGCVNPGLAMKALSNMAVRAGVRVLAPVWAKAIVTVGGRVGGVETSLGRIESASVVCSAGRGSSRLLRAVGRDFPVAVTAETLWSTTSACQLPRVAVRSRRVSFRPSASGGYVISAGAGLDVELNAAPWRYLVDFWPKVLRSQDYFRVHVRPEALLGRRGPWGWTPGRNMASVAASIEQARRFAMAPSALSVDCAWVGHIDITPDMLPVIEAGEKPRGLVIATGFSGHGFALGISVGSIVAELVEHGEARGWDIGPFSSTRFGRRTGESRLTGEAG